MIEFDETFDFASDTPEGKDPDERSAKLRKYHQILWSKPLWSGRALSVVAPPRRRDGYLIGTDGDGGQWWFGSDAITNSYTRWLRPRDLVEAKAALTVQQRRRYLNPSYTVGSTMIWPVRSADRPTINQARGTRAKIADRMDLTLECVRRHYDGQGKSPLSDVLLAYGDFFDLFDGFSEFVEFFHLQDLVVPTGDQIAFFLPFTDFEDSATPRDVEEFVEYSESRIDFIARRQQRIAAWVRAQSSCDRDGGGATAHVENRRREQS